MTKDQTSAYRAAFKEARAAFSAAKSRAFEIERELTKLNEEMRHLRRTITALAPLCSEEPHIDKLGITEACIEAMEDIPFLATTVDVARWIEMYGFDISAQKNFEASVHAVLTRLAEKGKIEKITEHAGAVKWKGPGYIPDEGVPF